MNSMLLFFLVFPAVFCQNENETETQINALWSRNRHNYYPNQLATYDFNLTCGLGQAFCFQLGVYCAPADDIRWYKRFSAPPLCTYKNYGGISLQRMWDSYYNATEIQLYHNCSDSGAIYYRHWTLQHRGEHDKITQFPLYAFSFQLHNFGEDCGSSCTDMATTWSKRNYFMDDNPALPFFQDGLKIHNDTKL